MQVQPLKVLAMRVVVMNKIDYSYLTGSTKEELDKMDKLAGKYRIQSSKLTIEATHNDKFWMVSPGRCMVPSDDWEYVANNHLKSTDLFRSYII